MSTAKLFAVVVEPVVATGTGSAGIASARIATGASLGATTTADGFAGRCDVKYPTATTMITASWMMLVCPAAADGSSKSAERSSVCDSAVCDVDVAGVTGGGSTSAR